MLLPQRYCAFTSKFWLNRCESLVSSALKLLFMSFRMNETWLMAGFGSKNKL